MNPRNFGIPIFLLLISLLACAGCADMPADDGDGGFFGPRLTPTPSVTPTPSYLVESTPISTPLPTPSPKVTMPAATQGATTYLEIYNTTLTFNYNVTAFGFDLSRAPMNIEYSVHPVMVTRVIERESDYGTHEVVTFERDMPSELAEFVLTIYDKNTLAVIAKEGYGKLYSFDETQQLIIRTPGNYQVEMTGSFVTVDVTITVPPENIIP
ncbi:MAG: hypothetical protein JXA08_09995 [Methanomicrobiaceae archaeon]|nr:hypothetical protein [Methanomicrobiaceae archaeon]